jgi:integrase
MAIMPVKGRENVFDVVIWLPATADSPRRRVARRIEGKRNALNAQRDLLNARGAGEFDDKPAEDEKPAEDAPLTFSAYAARYLDSREHEVSARTMQGYRDVLRWWVEPAIGEQQVDFITVTDVRRLYGELQRRGLATGTTDQVARVLSMVMRAAVEDELISRNPCRRARPPRADGTGEEAERGIEPEECRRLLRELEGTTVYAPCALAALTGLRRGELLALKWVDVDLAARELHVKAAIEQVRGAVTRQRPKTPRSRRTVPLSAKAIEIMRSHRAAQARFKLAHRAFWQNPDPGYVFPATRASQSRSAGRMWVPSAFTQALRKALARVSERRLAEFVAAGGEVGGFEPVSVGLHDFRHTAATAWLGSGGVRLEVVSRWLGHANSAITSRVYSHVVADEMREGVEATDSLV